MLQEDKVLDVSAEATEMEPQKHHHSFSDALKSVTNCVSPNLFTKLPGLSQRSGALRHSNQCVDSGLLRVFEEELRSSVRITEDHTLKVRFEEPQLVGGAKSSFVRTWELSSECCGETSRDDQLTCLPVCFFLLHSWATG